MTLREQMNRQAAGLPPPCLEVGDKGPLTLSVHLPEGETWVFAWSRFSHARLRGEDLTIVFGEQKIVLHGQNLAPVAKKIGEFNVEILRTIDSHYRALIPGTESFIAAIEIYSVPE